MKWGRFFGSLGDFALAYAIVGDIHITGWIFPACVDVFPIEGGDFQLLVNCDSPNGIE